MTQLKEMKCVPCEGGVEPLKGDELKKFAQEVPDWDVVEEHHLSRTFKFDDFKQTLDFVNEVGDLAEQEGHHPDIYFTYGKATIEIHTHKIDGLHQNDFVLASKIDELVR